MRNRPQDNWKLNYVIKALIIIFIAISFAACTYNIQPSVATFTPSTIGATHQQLNCKVLLLVPQEFANREYVSSFEGREIRLLVGPPATESIDALLRQRFVQVEKQTVSGDGTLDFIRLSSKQQSQLVIMRPRFVRLESSVRPFRYNIELSLGLDVAGLSQPITIQGYGIGTAGTYFEASIQKAADEALSQAIKSLASNLLTTCRETEASGASNK